MRKNRKKEKRTEGEKLRKVITENSSSPEQAVWVDGKGRT